MNKNSDAIHYRNVYFDGENKIEMFTSKKKKWMKTKLKCLNKTLFTLFQTNAYFLQSRSDFTV